MKYKAIEKLSHAPVTSNGLYITVLFLGSTFILDFWQNGYKTGRYAMNADTGEYASQHQGTTWTNRGLIWFFDHNPASHGYYHYFSREEEESLLQFHDSGERKQLESLIGMKEKQERAHYRISFFNLITRMETEYNVSRRETRSRNHMNRVNAIMDKIHPLPEGLEEWIDGLAAGGRDYMIKHIDKPSGADRYSCTACGNSFTEKQVAGRNRGQLPKNRRECRCPKCKAVVIMAKRGVQDIRTRFYLMQDVDDSLSVSRHFQVHINYPAGDKKRIWMSEAVRFVMLRGIAARRGGAYEIYFNQIPAYEYGYFSTASSWDTKKGMGGRFMGAGYLYPYGVTEALKDTDYEPWMHTFMAAAGKGLHCDYNSLMASKDPRSAEPALAGVCELLVKGRFYRLLEETSGHVNIWNGAYSGTLDIYGDSIEAVFGLQDRQLINRLRDKDGDELLLDWLRYSESSGRKLSDAFIIWVTEESIRFSLAEAALDRLSPEALMNYIIRQKKEQYCGRHDYSVLDQYTDYLEMASKEGKDLTDAMVYKPRELKRRHDELVEEINKREMIEQMKRDKAAIKKKAKEYRERFPGAEENLKEISPKFTWEDEEYKFIVPKSLLEIITEGQALHHCVGATDRYFDRIVQRETFIVFLRKASAPREPYYTIEVEPGGTVRQHRGAFDEEPDIEEIKPHIRKWQAHIRKYMTDRDHADAKLSKEKREANLEQLKRDKNTRVLSGLLEDFMEAV